MGFMRKTGRFVLLFCVCVVLACATVLLAGCTNEKPEVSEELPSWMTEAEDVVSNNDSSVAENEAARGVPEDTIGLAPEPKDGIKLTVNSGADKSFSVPTSGMPNGSSTRYFWIIDWGDGSTGEENGTGTVGNSIQHDYPYADATYIITIKPQEWPSAIPGDEPGWFEAFGFGIADSGSSAETSENMAKLLYVDGILDDYAINASSSGACWTMFSDCKNLKMGPNFNFRITKTEAKGMFAAAMFSNCTSLVVNDVFTFPQFSSDSLDFPCFQYTFEGVTAKQTRAASAIIGDTMNGYGNASPSVPIGTFSSSFDTAGINNSNWYTE